ncbi:putative two-component response regulator [Collimonas arenae]|uniref:Putative two-component response regulator n=1 Tax=Collimonas arenae TaxID=279058 RepID=A0A0A1F7I4_9BURK|nr:sigma 54-interacting transcriptional regulator [Collimonas arenae]AIY39649.1 putative two-component response regulator [Collimonas arenae]
MKSAFVVADKRMQKDAVNTTAVLEPRNFHPPSSSLKARRRTFAICVDSPALLARIRRVATTLFVSLRELDAGNVAAAIVQEPSLTVLLCLEDARFHDVVGHCRERALEMQDCLVRLVDGSDYGACIETAAICLAVNTPKTDTRLRELLAKFCEPTFVDQPYIQTLQPVPGEEGETHHVADTDHEVFSLARKIAGADVDIVLVGETGTGKDWLARFIHEHSGVSGPFMALNCAAIPETLAEAELFGVEVGAYTGATKSRAGRIEAARDGILYLDEIDSMPLTLQAKLLRALQERGIERVGSTVFRPCNFRVIASTKIPLIKLVEQGKFRADLHYRLSVVELQLPVLRNQPKRMLLLFWRCAAEAAARFKTRLGTGSRSELEAQILAHKWEGNIRELRAAAQRFALGFAPLPGAAAATGASSLKDVMLQFERSLLESTMLRCENNVARASKELNVEPHVLYYKLKNLGISSGMAVDGVKTGAVEGSAVTTGKRGAAIRNSKIATEKRIAIRAVS